MVEARFFKCDTCGNLVGVINDSGVPMMCCGKPMTELVPNTSDGAGEKHVPVVTVNGNKVTVKVGEVAHPMLDVHYIQWVYLQTTVGGHRKELKPGQEPVVEFLLENEEAVAAYEYCNLHGLWKAEIK